ncbi:MAG: ExeM/NucH family extracellular endonuclease [Lysobacterales bacterium]
MIRGNHKTPLHAVFFCAFLTACTATQSPPDTSLVQCPGRTSPIAIVQGAGSQSPMRGQQVTVQGIVTLIQNDIGLYVEEPASDVDRYTSNAVFIQSDNPAGGIEPGTLIAVSGTVTEIGDERDPLTALTDITQLVQCSSGHTLPLTDVSLPLDEAGRESIEGMRIRINDTLVVTDVYQFQQGKFTLSANGFQYIPTEVMKPGPAAADLLARNRASALPVLLPESMGIPAMLVGGTSVGHVQGVLAHDGRGKRLTLQSISSFSEPNIATPGNASAGSLRVVGMNLHNYFNGDGKGQGFPTPRGAETYDEFQHQRARIGAAIGTLDPHVLAVMELENDGFGPNSAAQDFIQLANETSQHSWAATRPVDDNTGSDKIAVGLFYRTDLLKAIGPSHTLGGPEFELSRQPQAQLFQRLLDGETLLIVINHLKSKGSCPESGKDANQRDGQGCWNAIRRSSAEKMSAWAKEVAVSAGTSNILILGDMNAYRNEDPIGAIREAGFTELMERDRQATYSFVYSGQRGTLDYAFTSDALLENVLQAYIWHVNAAFPAKMELPKPWLRFSDHDPVVVELRIRQSKTSD